MNTAQCDVPQDEIARRAYEIWQERGCPEGSGDQDWQAARDQLVAERISRNGSTQDRLRTLWNRLREKIAK
jgi:hypothetical protein